ncbi:DNA repair protein RecN [Candidatus Magnetobacterium bavaricum]|uniref:DNA repair protein RecN n=1 Tax=Candidatus Magnetobacterium bavaricum TaxID=29290 RepID=A0A0F3H0C6_9BACT|nr:DNA repair protein RecN [Candidatus Magnetobacterium bavaricum]
MLGFFMLTGLFIKNFAIIRSARIELGRGLSVLTGETGSGKSIIVDALGLILGQRGQVSFIKVGTKETTVEATFNVDGNPVAQRLGIPLENGLILRRHLSTAGKNRVYVNESSVSIQTLAEIGSYLVDVHSQHEHQSLLLRERQLAIVDSFGKIEDDVKHYAEILRKYNELVESRANLNTNIKERNQRIDLLRFQIKEIETADLKENEKKVLIQELSMLSNLNVIKELSEDGYMLVNSKEDSIIDQVQRLCEYLSQLTRYDENSGEMFKMATEVLSYVSELSLMLRRYKDGIDYTPERLEEVEERIDLIKRLEKKYGEGANHINNYRQEAQVELETLLAVDEKLDALDAEITDLKVRLNDQALAISAKRAETIIRLQEDINVALRELAFPQAGFEIRQTVNRAPDESLRFMGNGVDLVEFMFCANPGEPLRSLNKVASGGELSRIMLALKACLADVDDIPVLVFDEVDAGIGGETADTVGDKLKAISRKHQVLCITHLPQIACRADRHIRVSKKVIGEGAEAKVEIKVEKLSEDERQKELARMLSGGVTDISLKHARQLLQKHKGK